MSDRVKMLEEVYGLMHKYTKTDPWRPGLIDLWTYDVLLGMYESDYEDTEPHFLWKKKPDEVMEHILDKGRIFDMEYGWEQFDEEIRDYLIQNDFIVDPMNVSDEEYQNNLEGK